MIKINYDKKLGSGSFGTVFKGQYNKAEVAVKCVKSRSENEVQVQTQLNHDNIVKLLAVNYHGDYAYLALEFMQEGDLFALIYERSGPLNDRACVNIANDIVSGLNYLHEHGFLHRDIKPENILFNASMRAKIADFGFAIKENQAQTDKLIGTKIYISPELARAYLSGLDKYQYNRKTDVYALGMTLLEMMCRHHPYGKADHALSFDDIANGDHYKIPKHTPPVLANVIASCLIKEAAARIDIPAIMPLFTHEPFNKNATWRAPKYSELHLAARQGDAESCMRLLHGGGDPSLKNTQDKMPEELWPRDSSHNNPFVTLREDLHRLARQDPTLSNDRRDALMTLIFTHNTTLLTWNMQSSLNVENFINHVIAYTNEECITRLMSLAEWPRLSQTRTSKGFTVLHFAAYYSQASMYSNLGMCDVNDSENTAKCTPLHFAAMRGDTEWCWRLFQNKAALHLKNRDGKTAEELWPSNLEHINPFKELCRDRHLEIKKERIVSILDAKLADSCMNNLVLLMHEACVRDLYQCVTDAKFESEGGQSKTADHLLNERVDDWVQRHPGILARNQHGFFSGITRIFSAPIEEALDDIKKVYS